MHETVEPREPYRLFFPLGLLMAAAGVAPWILFHFGMLSIYPGVFHGRVMFHGFLMAFISGFLMTAVPRMSGTEACRPSEAGTVLVLLAAQLAVGGQAFLSAAFFSLHASFLLFFVLRRALRRRQNPPPSFMFVPVGLAAALIGGVLLLAGNTLPPEWGVFGKLLAFQGFVLNLIVGLGSRLVPTLSRAPGALSPMQGAGPRRDLLPLLVLFNLSFVLEAFVDSRAGIGLRALTLSWAVIFGLRLFAPLSPRTALGIALRISAAFLVLPYYLMLIFPGADIHWLHLSYIGGIGLMTLMVAVRVVLAHGGAGFEKESRSPGLIAAAALLVTVTLVRVFVPTWHPGNPFGAYALAATLWLGGLGSWWALLGRHIDRPFSVFKRGTP